MGQDGYPQLRVRWFQKFTLLNTKPKSPRNPKTKTLAEGLLHPRWWQSKSMPIPFKNIKESLNLALVITDWGLGFQAFSNNIVDVW